MQLSTGKPLLAVLLMLVTPLAWAADPVAGNQTDSNPLMLAITASSSRLDFALIVTVNNAPVVNLKFSSSLDGTETEVSGGDGKKMGTASVARDGVAYKILMEGPGRRGVTTRLTLSADGKTLV